MKTPAISPTSPTSTHAQRSGTHQPKRSPKCNARRPRGSKRLKRLVSQFHLLGTVQPSTSPSRRLNRSPNEHDGDTRMPLLDVNGVAINYIDEGTGPPVVLVH